MRVIVWAGERRKSLPGWTFHASSCEEAYDEDDCNAEFQRSKCRCLQQAKKHAIECTDWDAYAAYRSSLATENAKMPTRHQIRARFRVFFEASDWDHIS